MNEKLENTAIIPGQINAFEYLILKGNFVPNKVTRLEKDKKSQFSSLKQKKVYMKYFSNCKVIRSILYCNGSIGIEVIEDHSIKTHCIDIKGNEIILNGRSHVFPMDSIFYFSGIKIKTKRIQIAFLNEIIRRNRDYIRRIIKSKGDYNISIEYEDKVTSIFPCGWVLDFYSTNKVQCSSEEILQNVGGGVMNE